MYCIATQHDNRHTGSIFTNLRGESGAAAQEADEACTALLHCMLLVTHLLYADDIVLVALSAEGMRRMIDAFELGCVAARARADPRKCRGMVFRPSGMAAHTAAADCWHVHGHTFKATTTAGESFKYLGVPIDAQLTWRAHRERRLAAAARAAGLVAHLGTVGGSLPVQVQRQAVLAMVCSQLEYGMEVVPPQVTWTTDARLLLDAVCRRILQTRARGSGCLSGTVARVELCVWDTEKRQLLHRLRQHLDVATVDPTSRMTRPIHSAAVRVLRIADAAAAASQRPAADTRSKRLRAYSSSSVTATTRSMFRAQLVQAGADAFSSPEAFARHYLGPPAADPIPTNADGTRQTDSGGSGTDEVIRPTPRALTAGQRHEAAKAAATAAQMRAWHTDIMHNKLLRRNYARLVTDPSAQQLYLRDRNPGARRARMLIRSGRYPVRVTTGVRLSTTHADRATFERCHLCGLGVPETHLHLVTQCAHPQLLATRATMVRLAREALPAALRRLAPRGELEPTSTHTTRWFWYGLVLGGNLADPAQGDRFWDPADSDCGRRTQKAATFARRPAPFFPPPRRPADAEKRRAAAAAGHTWHRMATDPQFTDKAWLQVLKATGPSLERLLDLRGQLDLTSTYGRPTATAAERAYEEQQQRQRLQQQKAAAAAQHTTTAGRNTVFLNTTSPPNRAPSASPLVELSLDTPEGRVECMEMEDDDAARRGGGGTKDGSNGRIRIIS